ncbi:MAG TPA: class II aldolase/adducin family protein [Methylomirabilota bacterium]|nr:class II aldolase/adducin family protein [Methylomirabilota bacterium]
MPPPSPGPADPALVENLVAANRILAHHGVVDGWGHVSARHDRDANRYLMSRALAPELVTAADILEHDLDSVAVDGRGRGLYLERFIHGEIYRARPDVHAVVHHHSPSVIPFGVSSQPLRPIYHMAAFLGADTPVFEIRKFGGMTDLLVRDAALGRALAQTLGRHTAVLLRGHGAVVVGPTIQHAVARSVYMELNARLQQQAIALGNVTYLEPEEARLAEAAVSGTYARPWELWKRKVTDR